MSSFKMAGLLGWVRRAPHQPLFLPIWRLSSSAAADNQGPALRMKRLCAACGKYNLSAATNMAVQ